MSTFKYNVNKIDFKQMLSESFSDIKRKKQLTESEEMQLQEQYEDTLSNTMKIVERMIKKNSTQLKRSINEHLKTVANENYTTLNTTKKSLYEDLQNEFYSTLGRDITNIISESLMD